MDHRFGTRLSSDTLPLRCFMAKSQLLLLCRSPISATGENLSQVRAGGICRPTAGNSRAPEAQSLLAPRFSVRV